MKSFNNSSYKTKYAIISLLCVLATYVLPPRAAGAGFYLLAVVGVVELYFFEFFSTKLNGGRLSFASLFVPILYVFHFGQVLLLGFFANHLDEVRIVITYFSDEQSFVGTRLMNTSFVLLCNGILHSASQLPAATNRSVVQSDYLLRMRSIGKKLVIILFPIKFIIDMVFMYKSFTIGFLSSTDWLSAFPDVIKSIGELSLLGFALLLIGYKDDKKNQKKLFLFIIVYYLLLMTSGRRSENVAYVCGFTFLFLRTYTDKIKFKSLFLYALGAFVLLTTLTSVRNLRDGDRDLSIIVGGFQEAFYNPELFVDVLREYGDTGYTALCVLFLWLPKFSPSYGMSYILGLSAIFPNIGGLMGELSTMSAFGIAMQEHNTLFAEYFNIGGSILGELYFNFGIWGGVFASLLLGIFIGKVFNIVERALYNQNYIKVVTHFLVICSITYWIRDSFVGGVRIAVWSVLLCNYLLYKKNKFRRIDESINRY